MIMCRRRIPAVAFALLLAAAAPRVNQTWNEWGGSGTDGGVSQTAGASSRLPAIQVDGQGRPVIAWREDSSGGGKIWLRRWDGTAWVELGGSATGKGVSTTALSTENPSLALTSAGNPVVAWRNYQSSIGTSSFAIYVRYWTGSAWSNYGTSPNISNHDSGSTDDYGVVALDGNDRPMVAWAYYANGVSRVCARRWTGTAWDDFAGTGDNVDGEGLGAFDPAIAVDSQGRAVIAWVQGTSGVPWDIAVRRFDGTNWVPLTGAGTSSNISNTPGYSRYPKVCILPSGNPVVAWADDSSEDGSQAYLRQWTGSAWEELDHSGSGGGVSRSPSPAYNPSLALSATGRPLVAWSGALADGTRAIQARQWIGTSWVDIMEGDDSIPGTSGNSQLASVAVHTGTNPKIAVAWTDGPMSTQEILARYRNIGIRMPDTLTQLEPDGTVLGQGGATPETSVTLRATAYSPDAHPVNVEFEVREVGTALVGTPTATITGVWDGGIVPLTLTDLVRATGYHWRVRSVHDLNGPSAWVCYGSNPDDPAEVDFAIRKNDPPAAPVAAQFDPLRGVEITVGEVMLNLGAIRFRAILSDPELDRASLQIEARPVSQPFQGVATTSSPIVNNGSEAIAEQECDDGGIHWQARAVDRYGAIGPWRSFGNNAETEADVFLQPKGSLNAASCGQTAGFSAGILLPALGILLLRRRNS